SLAGTNQRLQKVLSGSLADSNISDEAGDIRIDAGVRAGSSGNEHLISLGDEFTVDVGEAGVIDFTGVQAIFNVSSFLINSNFLHLEYPNGLPPSNLQTGLRIGRGASADRYLYWNESDDTWR